MQSTLFTAVALPLALAVIMLGMGLSLVPDDFRRVLRQPKAVALGTVAQLVLLPLLGLLVIAVVPMRPEIAVGLFILAICPGGPSSNLLTYLARGDVALSVSLTAVSSVITVFTIPVLANLALQRLLAQSAAIRLPVGQTMLQIILMTLVPVAIGMAIRARFPQTARRAETQVSRLATGLLLLIILLLLVKEANRLPGFLMQVGVGVALLNGLAILAGLGVGRLFRLPLAQQLCLAIEVGIQNGTLAIAITAGLLNNPDMAVPAALYSLLMYLTGFLVVRYGRGATRLQAGAGSRAAAGG